jgi:PPK2 family polyphosphate:nucleotide phosphotransferase
MKISPADFRIPKGKKLHLRDWPTLVDPFYRSKKHYHELLEKHVEALNERQELLMAHDRYSVLIIFQAMDAAGKDSAIEHVMSGVNPQGCQVFSFKRPSEEEAMHDFLWRACLHLPRRGRIGIFNRSYYEEVLVTRVHPELLAAESLPDELLDEKTIWPSRFRSIRDFEDHLVRNGTRVIKIFLHVSKKEQRKRLLRRIDKAEKNWKFEVGDLTERDLWKQYMTAYQAALEATSTSDAPWYAVPADDKKNARLIVSQIVLSELEKLKMSYPKLDRKTRKELKVIRSRLAATK